ncbi:MAG: hypothetical protein ACT4OI_07030 [Methanobacteriota archaeon]
MTKAILTLALAGVVTALTAMGIASAQAPIEVPLFEEFSDLNLCTDEVVTYTFTGTARISEFDGHFILVARGSVVTSDGFSGSFNRQFVFQDDRVTVLRFHDMEVSDETGQMIVFGVGLIVEISADGEPVVSFLQFSGLRCVG